MTGNWYLVKKKTYSYHNPKYQYVQNNRVWIFSDVLQREAFWQRITKIHVLFGWTIAFYIWLTKPVLPISTLLCTLKTVTYPNHQIIKVCNSTTIVFNTLYLNVKTFFMNEYMLDGDLRSNNCHFRDDDQQAEPKLYILSNNQGAHEGINSLHLSVENDSEVMSCYYQ